PTYIKLDSRPPRGGVNDPVNANANPVQQGLTIYAQNCAGCHGADRAGQAGAIPALTDITARLTADQIKTIVAGGRGQMPGSSQLSARNLDALVAYLANPTSVTPLAP